MGNVRGPLRAFVVAALLSVSVAAIDQAVWTPDGKAIVATVACCWAWTR